MKAIRIAVQYPESLVHPMHRFVCESPAVEREVLLEGKVEDGVRTLLLYVEGERAAYETALTERLDVDAYDITAESDENFYLYVRGPNRNVEAEVFDALDRGRVVVASPVEFRDDWTMRLTLVGPSADLQSALDELPAELSVDVKSVGEYGGRVGRTLTDRQLAAMAAAWDCGYYAVPREAGIEAVADELDCAVSTASTLLRRGERELVAELFERPPDHPF